MQASFVVSNLRVGTPHSGPNGVVEWLGIARIDKLIDECRANAMDLQESLSQSRSRIICSALSIQHPTSSRMFKSVANASP